MPLKITRSIVFVIGLAVLSPASFAQDGDQSEREEMYRRYLEFPSYVKSGKIEPHWMADGSSFWYAEGSPANTVIWKVDPEANTKEPLFDATRLRKAFAEALGERPPGNDLPLETFNFLEDSASVELTVDRRTLVLDLETYRITETRMLMEAEQRRRLARRIYDSHGTPVGRELLSPDGRWFAGTKKHNLYLRSSDDDRIVMVTEDGLDDYEWQIEGWPSPGAAWSPDSSKLAVGRVDIRNVPKIPIVHYTKPEPTVEWVIARSGFSRTRAGAPIPKGEIFIVDVLSKRNVRADASNQSDQYLHIAGWRVDGSELLILRLDREFKTLSLLAANPQTGGTRTVLSETSDTFIRGNFRRLDSRFYQLHDRERFIWASERDGWNHLYLYDLHGRLLRRLTKGAFPVVGIEAVDEKAGWVYFSAHTDKGRPYDLHLCRVDLEGKRFKQLTDAEGQHEIRFSPSKRFFLDTHSSVKRPPVTELRKTDGTLLQTASRANTEALVPLRWKPPEEFEVKAADERTALYGVLYKPYDFDPNKKYPVIELIYGFSQMTFVPQAFTDWRVIHSQALAQLGFIVFQVDARGTPGRSKAFQDAFYGVHGRHEIPDHVASMRQLAERRPYMDLKRVGIYGHSGGGYSAIRAMLLVPDVYHVAVASSPVTGPAFGNAMESYMGLPQNNPEGYNYGSNLHLAGNLKGKLLIMHGTSDRAAPLSETMRMVDALIEAGKAFDLILLPERTHSIGRNIAAGAPLSYEREAIRRYFQEHLKP